MGTYTKKWFIEYGAGLSVLLLITFLVGGFGVFWDRAYGFSPKKLEIKTEPLHPNVETVWVTRSDGAQSCDPLSGMSLTKGAEELKSINIPTLETRKGMDSKVRIQVCGASKGSMNSFRIPRKNLKDALSLGYSEVSGR